MKTKVVRIVALTKNYNSHHHGLEFKTRGSQHIADGLLNNTLAKILSMKSLWTTHDCSNDKPYEYGLETLKGE